MDFTTLIGIVACLGLVVFGIISEDVAAIMNFYDLNSIFITFGGAIGAIIASFPGRVLATVPKHLKIVFFGKKQKPMAYIDSIVEYAQLARKNGLLALEEKANQEKDSFLKSSILLIVDAMDADKIRQMMEGELVNLNSRHQEGISIYEKGAAFGPAFGMIGTLIGLINMLKGLDLSAGASDKLGEGMSVALITTFYGSMFANVICTPIANKLQVVHESEMLCKEIVIEGVLSIQSGENPKFIREKLLSFLAEKKRTETGKKKNQKDKKDKDSKSDESET